MKVKRKISSVPTVTGTPFVTIGTRGCSIFWGKLEGKEVRPLYDHAGNPTKVGTVPVGPGLTLPWSRNETNNAAHAWVSENKAAVVTIAPLDLAVRRKLVVTVEEGGKTLYVPASHQKGQKLPQYCGYLGNAPRGRVESKGSRDAKTGQVRNGDVLRRVVLATPKPAKAKVKPPAKVGGTNKPRKGLLLTSRAKAGGKTLRLRKRSA